MLLYGQTPSLTDLYLDPPVKPTMPSWWTTAPLPDKRNFIRSLISNSLNNVLRSPHKDVTYHHNHTNLDLTFKQQHKPLHNTLYNIKESL